VDKEWKRNPTRGKGEREGEWRGEREYNGIKILKEEKRWKRGNGYSSLVSGFQIQRIPSYFSPTHLYRCVRKGENSKEKGREKEEKMYQGCDSLMERANLEGGTMNVANITSPMPGTM
jgi:hypothetical protein